MHTRKSRKNHLRPLMTFPHRLWRTKVLNFNVTKAAHYLRSGLLQDPECNLDNSLTLNFFIGWSPGLILSATVLALHSYFSWCRSPNEPRNWSWAIFPVIIWGYSYKFDSKSSTGSCIVWRPSDLAFFESMWQMTVVVLHFYFLISLGAGHHIREEFRVKLS